MPEEKEHYCTPDCPDPCPLAGARRPIPIPTPEKKGKAKQHPKLFAEPAPVLLTSGFARVVGDGKQARLKFVLNLHDFELRHLLPQVIQDAYEMMLEEKEIEGMALNLDYEDQTVELGPYPTGKSQVKRAGSRLFDFALERKQPKDAQERLNLVFTVEMNDADGGFGRWLLDNGLGQTVILSVRETQAKLPNVEPEV